MSGPAFNPRQKAAIEHGRGPMLVVAGAGTGKTTVLTERVARLIQRKLAQPGEIVALTYTIAAAAELADRVRKAVKTTAPLAALNFHQYCYRLLEQHGRAFATLDDTDLSVFLRRRLHDLPLAIFRKAADPGRFLNSLNEFFRRCHDELVSAADYSAYVAEMKAGRAPLQRVAATKEHAELEREEVIARCEEVAAVYRQVEALLAERNLGTFGMQITGAVALLRSDAAVLAAERAKARFILVDEFQDSNQALIELVKLLAGEEQNVFAVGDPDQAIYRFRGASAAAFDSFHRAFPGAEQVTLAENYRSLAPVLDTAYRVIQKNDIVAATSQMSLVREPLRSARAERARAEGTPLAAAPVSVVLHDGPEHEAYEIAEELAARHDVGDAKWADFSVLYRQKDHREELVRALRERGIPFVVEGLDALDVSEVRDLVAAMRALVWPAESAALLRLAAFAEFGMDAERLRADLASAPRDTRLVTLLDKTAAGKKVRAAIAEMNRAVPPATTKAAAYVEAVLRRFGIERGTPAMRAFVEFVRQWQEKPLAESGVVTEFLDYLEMFREFGGAVALEAGEGEDAVRLMTVHVAKGREFRHVYVVRATSNSFPVGYHEALFEFPHALRHEPAAPEREPKELHYEEERRLFYVAMTRAQDSLTLLGKRARGREPVPGVYLRELAAAGRGEWVERPARALVVDLAAATAALPQVSMVAPWLMLPARAEMATMPLSVSAIEAYDCCPLKFKIKYDWRLPEEPSGALLYGATMHNVLKDYIEQVRAGNTPSDESVLAGFRAELAAAPFDDSYQQQLYERDGVRQLAEFLAAWRAQTPPPEVLSTERNFKVEIGGVTVRGRIDRIDRCADGAIAIVDYKTGKSKDQKAADDSLQLSVYALAAPLDVKLKPDRMVFYNLGTNQAVVTKRTPEKLAKAEEKVREVAASVRAGNFAPTPGYHCKWCGYKDLCPATEEKSVRVEKLEKLVPVGGES